MALSFEQWQKQKKKLEDTQKSGGTLSFDQWKKAKDLNIINQPSTVQPDIQSTTQGFFSPEDTNAISETLKGFTYGIVPGSKQTVKTVTSPNHLQEATKIPGAVASDAWNMVKGIAGLPLRTAATAVDTAKTTGALLTGKKLDTKDLTSFMGQNSMQKNIAENLDQGVSGPVAGTLAGAGTLFDYLLGKGLIKGGTKLATKSMEGDIAKSTAPAMLGTKEPVPPIEPVKPQLQIPAEASSLKKPIIAEAPKNYTPVENFMQGKNAYDVPQQYKIEKPFEVAPKVETTIPKDYGSKMRAFIKGDTTYEEMLKKNEPKVEPVKPTVENTPLVELDSLLKSPTQTKWQGVKQYMTRNNPLAFESSKIASYGEAGKTLVTKVRRAWATSVSLKEEFRQFNKENKIMDLTPEEKINMRDIREKGAVPINEKMANLAPKIDALYKRGAELTQIPPQEIIPNYFKRVITKEGLAGLGKITDSSSIAKQVAEAKGISVTEAVDLLRGSVRKAGLERSRLLPDELANKIREDPVTELLTYQEEVSRRAGIIQELGKDAVRTGGQQIPVKALDLIDQMVTQAKNPGEDIYIRKQAGAYIDKVLGRSGNYSDMKGALRFLKSSMVTSKLNPATAVANSFQGLTSSWGDYGVRGLLDTMNKSNDVFIKKLGFDNLKADVMGEVTGQMGRMDKFTKVYTDAIGMNKGERNNFLQTARSTTANQLRAFEALKKNPNDKIALKAVTKDGAFLEKGSLERALKEGKFPDSELAMSVIEGVRRKMFPMAPGERPAWASTPIGSTAYIFHNYLLSQMKLVSSWPLHRQIMYIGIIAPMLGIPPLILRKVLQGKALPNDPADWFMQSSQAGPGTPFDVYKTLSNPQFFTNYLTGGFSPIAEVATAKGASGKAKAAIRGFAPGSSIYTNWIFPSKQ